MKTALALVHHPALLILDGDYIDNVWKSRVRSGEQRLMLAILKEALDTFFKHLRATDETAKEVFQEVDGWIRAKDNDWIFSFENVCEPLEIDASYLRAELCRQGEPKPPRAHTAYRPKEKARRRVCRLGRAAAAGKSSMPPSSSGASDHAIAYG